MLSVYNKKTELELSTRRLEVLEKYNKIIQYGRSNPVWFIENIFKIELLDYQKWLIMNSWTTEKAVWVCSRNTGKTFIGSTFIMAKNLLFPSFETWLMSLTAAQAQGLFKKMEDIAKKNISSVIGSSDVFYNEVVKNQANTDGFLHNPSAYTCELFNGSHITSLVGRPESVVGKRSNLNVYDEAGKISHDYFALTEPFTTQDTNFKTGVGIDLGVYPKSVPTQCLYMSSAEDVNSYLYEIYKNGAKAMMMGRKDWFVADINCDIPLNPTKNGKAYPPLFKKSEVENAMRNNEYRALREYYNLFDTTGGNDCVITRDAVIRNEEGILPVSENDGTGKKYVICYDPALMSDNSFILVGEVYKDEKTGEIMGRIINGYNLIITLPNKEKKIMTSTEQLEFLRKIILKYNGNAPDYENIILFIDPGSGGGGHIYSDFLMQSFVDDLGIKHRGLIDMEDEKSALEAQKFPEAVKDVLHLYTAAKYKNEMFAAMSDLVSQDFIKFPITAIPSSGKIEVNGKSTTLTRDELRGLLEIDLMKEEAYQIRKIKTEAGNIRYSLPPDKSRRMHDDRAYCFAAFCLIVSQLRRSEKFDLGIQKQDLSVLYRANTEQEQAQIAQKKQSANPFSGRLNPFARR